MKKLICICIITAVMLSAGIIESVLVKRYFDGLAGDLAEMRTALNEIGEGDLGALEDRSERILSNWSKYEKRLLTVVNHNVINSVEERLVSLNSWIRADGYGDALAFCESAYVLATFLANESGPTLSNMF